MGGEATVPIATTWGGFAIANPRQSAIWIRYGGTPRPRDGNVRSVSL